MGGDAVLKIQDGCTVRINAPSARALLDAVEARLAAGEGFAVATINLDHMVKLRNDPSFRDAYAGQTHVVADGNPVVWLCALAGRKVDLVPGSELVGPLCALAARMGAPLALLGANDETLAAAAERLEADHPGLKVVARIAPPYGFDPTGPGADACLDQLAASGARLCLLALGAPKQEILAARARTHVPGCGFVSVGAGVDFVTGAQVRAPAWVRRLTLEWLWRMASDPRRLAGRYLGCAAILPGLAIRAIAARGDQPPPTDTQDV
ncbi:MAG: N-acetylglucosaminyldiphosphoundecaprenol N-acetyl-beta-D-mannosaminyltransferase [Paracoccaceae bacterium]|jgi:N-acetylglucosaminyldiphosphoundecaprenol N-acetyl-beta-D-mannosaminyltransferase